MVLKEDPQTRVRAAGRLIMRSTSKEDSVLRRPSLAAMMLAGGALLVASGTIHLRLWYQAYRHIPTIGPLFLVPGIAGILLAMGMVGYRRLGTAVAGAGYMAASIGGLLVSTKVGLFGFHDSLLAPYARLSLNLEIAGLIVLAGAALLLVAPTFDNVLKSVSSGRSRRSVVQTQRSTAWQPVMAVAGTSVASRRAELTGVPGPRTTWAGGSTSWRSITDQP